MIEFRYRWTAQEQKGLIAGIQRFGTDYEKIAELIGTKDPNQCQNRAKYCSSKRKNIYKEFPNISQQKKTLKALTLNWNEDEQAIFIKVVEKHGLDIRRLQQVLPKRNKADLIRRAN